MIGSQRLWRGISHIKLSKVIRNLIVVVVFLYTAVLMIAMICPQYKLTVRTGSYHIAAAKCTWTDNSRTETYSQSGDKRSLRLNSGNSDKSTGKCPLERILTRDFRLQRERHLHI